MPSRVELMVSALEMKQAEKVRLKVSVRQRYHESYRKTITALLSEYGCTQSGNPPNGAAASGIADLIDRDLDSITSTYNNDIVRKVAQVVSAHPEWSLEKTKAELQSWLDQRNTAKDQQITRASQTNGAEYARSLFFQHNRVSGALYIWDANPPIVENSHKECISRVKGGAVAWDIAKDYKKSHPNCRHKVQQMGGDKRIDCKTAWRG